MEISRPETHGAWRLWRNERGGPARLEARCALQPGTFDDRGRMPVRILASTEAINSFGFRVRNDAIRAALDEYNENPILLAYHSHEQPVGRGRAVMTGAGMEYPALSATNPDGAYISGGRPDIQALVADGTLRGASIAFDVVEDDEGADGIPEVTRLRLIETSVVPAGANPEAFVESLSAEPDEIPAPVAAPPSLIGPALSGCVAALTAANSVARANLSDLARQREITGTLIGLPDGLSAEG